jgi:hypothetical protein
MDSRLEMHRQTREVVASLVDRLVHMELRPQAEPVLAAVPPVKPVSGPSGAWDRALPHQGVATGVEIELREFRIVGRTEFAPVPVDRDIYPRPDRLQLPRRQSENGRGASPMFQTHLTHSNNAHRFFVVDDVLELSYPSQVVLFWRCVFRLGGKSRTRHCGQQLV